MERPIARHFYHFPFALMAKIASIHQLLLHELGDLLDAEEQILEALPKMIKAVSNEDLRDALTRHERETKGQVTRLEKAFELLDAKPKRIGCKAMEGLIKEGEEVLKTDMPPSVMDAAIIGAAQRVEHYEMAAYGTARAHAEVMEHEDVAELLQETLDEEGDANETLNELAESTVNEAALGDNPDMEEGDDDEEEEDDA